MRGVAERTEQIGLSRMINGNAEVAVELIPVQLDPTTLQADSCSDEQQSQQKETDHENAGKRRIEITT